MQRHRLHGGFIPSGASFFCFTDYCRPSLRLAALMGIRVVHVFTHDFDRPWGGWPTHQPVEHLAAMRAMPNFYMLAPGRQRRDGRVLAGGARARALALDPGADAAGPAGAADHPCGGELVRARRLRDFSRSGQAGGVDLRLRLRSVARRRRAGAIEGERVAARVVSLPCFPSSSSSRRTIAARSSARPRSRSASRRR